MIYRNLQFIVLTIVLKLLTSFDVDAMLISCESKEIKLQYYLGLVETCFMERETKINSDDTTLSPDATIIALTFKKNKNISFLPIEVANSFPDLKYYSASFCSIKSVMKKHFKDLSKLKILRLDQNEIVKIKSDAFEDLVSLRWVYLRKQFCSLI